MAAISTKPFDINKFWEKTPNALKYLVVTLLIIVGSYYLFSKTVTIGQIKQLNKIEESIATTYSVIDKFEEFERKQYAFNEQTTLYLKNIYTLIEELNDNTNKKFNVLMKANGKNSTDVIEKLQLLNESFEKLQKAYSEANASPAQNPDPNINIEKVKKNK